jgi:hypothetical protein
MADCGGQDAIFEFISNEQPPTDPRIEGSPSKIVSISNPAWDTNEKLYVANGSIWEYDMGGWWHGFGGPGGYVADVAATSTALYAYTIHNTSTAVWKKTTRGGGWTLIGNSTGYGFIQNIYGAGNQLFATGAMADGSGGNSGNYAILYETSGSFSNLVNTGSAILTGAGVIGSDYYLGTLGNGIYKVTGAPSPGSTSPLAAPTHIAGFLQANTNLIIAVTRGSSIWRGTSAGFTDTGSSVGLTCTGGLALTKTFTNSPSTDLLLIGIRGGTSSSGYYEADIDLSTGAVSYVRPPGISGPGSIEPNGNYGSSLKRYPVNHLFADTTQSPPVIFAATQGNNLYSYRSRSGVWQWNYEE